MYRYGRLPSLKRTLHHKNQEHNVPSSKAHQLFGWQPFHDSLLNCQHFYFCLFDWGFLLVSIFTFVCSIGVSACQNLRGTVMYSTVMHVTLETRMSMDEKQLDCTVHYKFVRVTLELHMAMYENKRKKRMPATSKRHIHDQWEGRGSRTFKLWDGATGRSIACVAADGTSIREPKTCLSVLARQIPTGTNSKTNWL